MSSSSQQLYTKIDSSQRLNYTNTNPANFIVNLRQVIQGNWRLCQVYMPSTNYNISTTNNRIPFIDNGVPKTATLTPGYYTSNSTLLNELALQMTIASAGFGVYTCVQSILPLRLTISSTQPFQLLFGSANSCSAANVLGFLPVDSPMATSQEAVNGCNLAQVRSFNIRVNNQAQFYDTTGRNCTFMVPIIGNSNEICIYEPSMQFSQRICFDQPTSVLNIQVVDENGVTLGLCADWYFILARDDGFPEQPKFNRQEGYYGICVK
jgi:hypothetical protein